MISVIISTYNSERYIKTCIDAVAGSKGAEFEIIIVDAGSTRQKPWHLGGQAKAKNLRSVFLPENVGLTVTHNMGARLAVGEYLLFLDVDTKLDKNALAEIVKFFEKNHDCGALQGKLVDRDGNVGTVGHFLSPIGFPYEIITPPGSHGFSLDFARDQPATPGVGTEIFGARGACLAVRKEVFEKIGGFDEDFFMHNEETDLCWRVWLFGYRIYYLPSAVCTHFGKSHYHSATPEESLRATSGESQPATSGVSLAYNRLFYEGAKNQITMIMKNASMPMLFWMLPLNVLGWMAVGLKSVWVYRGIGRAFLSLGKTIKKRKKVLRKKGNEAEKVMFGEVGFIELIRKGWKWAKNI